MLFSGAGSVDRTPERENTAIASDDCREREQRSRRCRPTQTRPAFLHGFEFPRQRSRCLLDRRKGLRLRRARHASLRTCRGHAGDGRQRLVLFQIFGHMSGDAGCDRHRHNPSPVAPC